MPGYTVRIETSVRVNASTPQEAIKQAVEWAEESLTDSNAIATVFKNRKQKPEFLYSKEL